MFVVPNSGMRFGFPAAIAIAVTLLLALPAAASAADTYADASAPDNSGDCLSPATACQTIGGVDGALSKSGSGDTTFVADGTYAESVLLEDGKSLLALDAGDPRPLIDNGSAASPAITIDSGGTGTVSGFRIRSDFLSMQIDGAVTVDDNVFDEESVPSSTGTDVDLSSAEAVVISDNEFLDPDAAGQQGAIQIDSAGSDGSAITDNVFTDLAFGVSLSTTTSPQITGNQFLGMHAYGVAGLPGAGVLNLAGTPTLTANTFAAAVGSPVVGVYVETTEPVPTGATLSRNLISNGDVGVQVVDSSAPVTLSNDVIWGNGVGLESTDRTLSNWGDVSATNVTIFGNGTDVRLDSTALTLDSSILGDPIDLVGGNGACQISFSRGSSDPVANGCDEFDTNADPEFVDASTGDFHLQSISPLIDIGDPADPGSGAVDFYGGPRAVQGASCNAVRRDIGAAEFQPSSPPQCAQDTYADAARPDDDGDCLSPATACKTIVAALAKSDDGQTTFVADGSYAEEIILEGDRSLVSLDSSDPRPVIDSGTDTSKTAVRVQNDAGTVSGFRIRSDGNPMMLEDATAEIEDNVFDDGTVPLNNAAVVIEGGSGIEVHDNLFQDPNQSGAQFGVLFTDTATDAAVADNTFTDLSVGVVVGEQGVEVTGNQFSGARPPGAIAPGAPGSAVSVALGDPLIAHNTIGEPRSHPSAGILVQPLQAIDSVGATLRANRISGSDTGVQVIDATLPVSLSNDLIYGNTVGVESTDTSADDPTPSARGDVSAINATVFGNAVDLQLSYTPASLSSTILGGPVDFVGDGACSIAYSRGSAAASANGCGSFATTADPQFVDAAAGNYRLQAGSALIDIGDSAGPGVGAVDFYGGPRALQGKACSTARRDIGAAEYDPGTTAECVIPPTPAPTPEPQEAKPPAPRIEKRPQRRSSDRTPTFEFSSEADGTSFRCRLDNRAWKACTAPATYAKLSYGKHRFRVQTVSPSGKRSRIKTVRFWVLRPE